MTARPSAGARYSAASSPSVAAARELAFRDGDVVSFEGGLVVQKKRLKEVSVMMGKAMRSPITAEISFRDLHGLENFVFVDVAKRPGDIISGRMQDLEKDPYIFKAIPLLTRTWIYSSLIQSKTVLSTKHDPNESIKYVLGSRCVDAPVSVGLPSPLLYYVPGSIGTSLCGNHTLSMLMLAVIALLLFISKACNNWTHYRQARLYSLPLRVAFLVVVLLSSDFSGFLASVGYLLTLVAIISDLITGDVMSGYNFGMACTYEIISALEGRLFVCRRHGAYQWEDIFGFRGRVETQVSGLANWDREHHLIADIGDIICELRPLTKSDWEKLRERCLVTGATLDYLAIGAIDMDAADAKKSASGKLATDMVLEEVEEF